MQEFEPTLYWEGSEKLRCSLEFCKDIVMEIGQDQYTGISLV